MKTGTEMSPGCLASPERGAGGCLDGDSDGPPTSLQPGTEAVDGGCLQREGQVVEESEGIGPGWPPSPNSGSWPLEGILAPPEFGVACEMSAAQGLHFLVARA